MFPLVGVGSNQDTQHKPLFEYQSVIKMPGAMALGICIANHLNNEHVKFHYLDVSAIQIFAIQIPTVQ